MAKNIGLDASLKDIDVYKSDKDIEEEKEQLELLPMPLDMKEEEKTTNSGVMRGRGRPSGSKNKNTEAWTKFFLNNYRSPLEILGETYSMKVGDLATKLNCKKEVAFKFQIAAAQAVAGYIHQKQPIAIDLQGEVLPMLVLADPNLIEFTQQEKEVEELGEFTAEIIDVTPEEKTKQIQQVMDCIHEKLEDESLKD